MATSFNDVGVTGPKVNKPALEFESETLTLADILHKYKLPRVVQCTGDNMPGRDTSNNVDFAQPLLAFCKNSVRKVCAYSVSFNANSRQYVPVGDDLLIPENYMGWFAVMGYPDVVTTDQSVPHYRTLAHLATSQCLTFLVGGNKPIEGIMMDGNKGKEKPIRCQILPGEVLRKGGNYIAQHGKDEKKKKKKKYKVEPPQGDLYLKCYDEHDREIFVHAKQECLIFIVSQSNGAVKTPILQMTSIISSYKFPLLVKLVYGRVPSIPCAFTGTLLLTDSGMSHTVVASTLFNVNNINLEIPLGSDMLFQVAQDTPGLRVSKAYEIALQACEMNVTSYMKNIKVIVGDPQLEHDHTETGSVNEYDNATPMPLADLQSSTKSLPETSTSIEGDIKIRHAASTRSRKSSFKILSTLPSMTNDILNDTLKSNSGLSNSRIQFQEDILESPGLSRFTTFDPPALTSTIPIKTGPQPNPKPDVEAGSINHIYEIENHSPREVDISSLTHPFPSPKSSPNDSLDPNYIQIWRNSDGFTAKKPDETPPISDENPTQKPKRHIAGNYLTSPIYNSDSQTQDGPQITEVNAQRKERVEKLPDRPPVPHRLNANKSSPLPPVPEQRLSDTHNKFRTFESHSVPSTPSDNSDLYINVGSMELHKMTLAESVRVIARSHSHNYDRISPHILEQDDHYQKPDTIVSNNNDSDYLTPIDCYFPNEHVTPPNLDQADNPYTDPDLDGYVFPGIAVANPGRRQVVDSGVYEEEDVGKDENGNVEVKGFGDEKHKYKTLKDVLGTSHPFEKPLQEPDQFSERTGISALKPSGKNISQLTFSKSLTSLHESSPSLPPRPTRLKKSASSSQADYSVSNKTLLLDELKHSGISISKQTELAIKGLQLADLTQLLSKTEDLDAMLIALLPKVGQLDLKRIAMCLRKMKVDIK
ncbi:unnamed protein product [Lymnaea stagnalis]|uniref:CABIT domain-containing protein n=1 Tax=Lymnaea stagnalis TaxID=6523 RepID=A0AAV2HBN9_LYMST